MEIKIVTDSDKEFVMSIDKHVNNTGYANRVYAKSGYVIWEGTQRIGIMTQPMEMFFRKVCNCSAGQRI